MKMGGLLFLIIGILFLLRDVGVWNFWNIQWWSALFIIGGIGAMCSSCCANCGTCCTPDAKKKK
jgi:hypothetical protein